MKIKDQLKLFENTLDGKSLGTGLDKECVQLALTKYPEALRLIMELKNNLETIQQECQVKTEHKTSWRIKFCGEVAVDSLAAIDEFEKEKP